MRIPNPPLASSLMATARSFGNYDLAAALADLIDNSIRAKARRITIQFIPEGKDVTVRIRDDGKGMAKDELIKAMRPASTHPDEQRDASDLGRFGWGLKSASLSQGKILTVVSWTSESCTAASWNIDDLEDWSMDLLTGDKARKILASAPSSKSGTEVIWTNCDRLLDSGLSASIDDRLNEKITSAHKKLSLIFHRYLSGETGRALAIEMQGIELRPIDPFMSTHPATQSLDEEKIKIRGREEISVKPFTIPHFSKLTVKEKGTLGGDEGLIRNQGFYVYRNKRLIIYGTWFRLVPHGELSQLTRIRVDLPNTLDKDWKITLDKSDAQLPVTLRTRLKELVKKFSKRSIRANRRKGADLTLNTKETVWKRNAHNGRIRYRINRDHPMIWQMIAEAEHIEIVRETLNLIESYVPIDSILKDRESEQLDMVQAITDPEAFDALLDTCFISYARQIGKHPRMKEFLDFARHIEPFSSQWKYSESYIRSNLKDKWSLK
jgi:hypothetical protein